MRFDPETLSVLNTAAILPDTAGYSTVINLFPGNNAHEPWGKQGSFCVTLNIFQQGKQIGKIHSPHCNEKGNIRVNLDDFADLWPDPVEGIMVIEYFHEKSIPVEVYTNHVHRATGSYFATNAIAFIGDKLAPVVHATQLENTLFWPGVICNEDVETQLVVINPYRLNFSFQTHLFLEDGTRRQSGVIRLAPRTSGTWSLEKLFPDDEDALRDADGKISFCVTSQYKQVSYARISDRRTGIVTTMDHLHNYCLY